MCGVRGGTCSLLPRHLPLDYIHHRHRCYHLLKAAEQEDKDIRCCKVSTSSQSDSPRGRRKRRRRKKEEEEEEEDEEEEEEEEREVSKTKSSPYLSQ